ncbi:MAG: hypothetical protein AVDCRST_MAG56-7900 [uncultured Cytophagales bacterium]|uniref:Uncharacterized protein n=1 Tax=uncultured Cytophagales bacterium TaxID=158755 RepID=A0A6J4LTJ5_9SPHI|nr:MAG: hypothetical protein AVDCRST_MAG56-7900 [uncultured Cytophagales bacterium]
MSIAGEDGDWQEGFLADCAGEKEGFLADFGGEKKGRGSRRLARIRAQMNADLGRLGECL